MIFKQSSTTLKSVYRIFVISMEEKNRIDQPELLLSEVIHSNEVSERR